MNTFLDKYRTKDSIKQQQIIEKFYKELFAWKKDNTGMWLVVGLMETFTAIFMCFPYQVIIEDEGLYLIYLMGLWGATYYIMPYVRFNECGKQKRISEKLKYLPVSFRELRRFCIKKLAIFCIRLTGIFLVLQLFFAIVSCGEVVLGNFGYPILFGLVLPFGVGLVSVWLEK